MATHSSVLAWRIPGTGEPGGLLSMGSQSRTRLKRLSSSSNLGSRNQKLRLPVSKTSGPFYYTAESLCIIAAGKLKKK